jgi:hypothetical protein
MMQHHLHEGFKEQLADWNVKSRKIFKEIE